MKTDPRDPDQIWATAVHEAGHAVIARVLSFPCGRTSIIVGGDTSGYSNIKECWEATDYWERAYGKHHRDEDVALHARSLVYMAGRAAEEEILRHCPGGDDDDQYWINRMISFEVECRLRKRIPGLVRRHRARIETLAHALIEQRSMDDGQIRKTIGIPYVRRKPWLYWTRRAAARELPPSP